MKVMPPSTRFERAAQPTSSDLGGCITFVIRAAALIVFVMMALAEPVIAAILGFLALGCFFVSVFFGFILHAPFKSRWIVLTASVVFVLVYLLYRLIILGVQRLLD